MRPVKLTIQAFGSYGKLTQIDFQEPNQNLFLVTGDTGAGKTTIFDAIVFALYGEASSSTNKKEGVVLQSQYVELNVEPFVELVFSEGTGADCQLYTVRRVPRHLKLLTRGAGKNTGSREVAGSVSLIMPDGTEYPQKEADGKLGEILGLTKNQFMQVAMIAQGEFMELLRAKSDDKKVIFRKLFNTELYQNIVDELMNRKRALEKDIAQIKTACQTEAAHVVIPQEYELREEVEGLKKQILNGEIVVMDSFLEHLGDLCRMLKENTNSAAEELQSVSKLRDEKRDIYNSATQLKSLYAQLETAQVQLSECMEVEIQIGEKAILAEKIKKAYEIKGEYTLCQDAQRNMQTCESALKEQRERAPLLKVQSQSAFQTAKLAKETTEKELQTYTSVYERVNKEVKLLKQIKEAENGVKTSQKKLNEARNADRKAREELERMEKQEADWRAQSEKLTDTNEKIAVWKGKNQELEALGLEVQETATFLKNVEAQKNLAQKARNTYQQIRNQYDTKNQEYESMRRIFLDEQAGFLARELQPGKPCPVCGAVEHPNPCTASAFHGDLTREQLELAEKEASELRSKQEKSAGEAKSAADLVGEKEKNLEETGMKLCRRILNDRAQFPEEGAAEIFEYLVQNTEDFQKNENSEEADKTEVRIMCREKAWGGLLDQIQTLLGIWKTFLQKEGMKLSTDQKTLHHLQESLGQIEEQKKLGKNAVEECGQNLTAAIAAAKSAENLLKQLNDSREYSSEEAAMAEFNQAKGKWKAAEKVSKEAEKEEKSASEDLVNCTSLIKRYEEELPERQKLCQERQDSYQAIMKEKDMAEQEWIAIAENYTRETADMLQKEADVWHRKKLTAQTAAETAEKAIDGRNKPDIEAAKSQMEEAETTRIQTQNKLDLYKEQYKADKDAYDTLTPQMEKRGKIIEKHAKLETLYKLLSGNMSGNRMDLETYVQRYYLEKILYAANRRFADMSAGQFELRMVNEENAGKGKNRGLDLMVYSNVTGKEREVRTLSGGESFMAALALALGMADQIQESSAAIHLDVMFVDEGFGSLDEHSREQAVKVLQELAGGSKLIGIISHVTELKQEIEDQLIVSKDEKGSHVKWQIS